MPAMAALGNPSGIPGAQIQVFYMKQNTNLAFVLKGLDASQNLNRDFGAGDTDRRSAIIPNAQIAASTYLGFPLVVGFTTPVDPNSATVDVSMISPTYQPLAKAVVSSTKSIAVVSKGTDANIFYLSNSGPNDPTTYVYGRSFLNPAPFSYTGIFPINPNTSLGAYYDSKAGKRWFIYQVKSSVQLAEYCLEDKTSITLDSTDGARMNTPIAVTYTNGTVCCYFVNNANRVRCIYKRPGEGWGAAQNPKENTDTVKTDSQLALVGSQGVNYLYWDSNEGGASTFSFYADVIPDPPQST